MALIEKKTDKLDPDVFKDHYQAELRELIALAHKLRNSGRIVTTEGEAHETKPTKSNVVDLMAALKSSLEGSNNAPTNKAAAKNEEKAAMRKKAS
jgi:DNA end-binding protein Ku